MQKTFSQIYSHYYDLLYRDKNYEMESEQIDAIIKLYQPVGKKIINIGCGTGSHDFKLASKGYTITGIDSSSYMLDIANQKKGKANLENIDFLNIDVRHEMPQGRYDVALSLFHVTSYFTEDEEVKNVFSKVYKVLKKGGIYIFDFWHAAGILHDLPEKRSRIIEDESVSLKRIFEPETDLNSNIVTIKLTLEAKKKETDSIEIISEVHSVRFFSLKEIEGFLTTIGFEIVNSGSDYELNAFVPEDRYATIIARK